MRTAFKTAVLGLIFVLSGGLAGTALAGISSAFVTPSTAVANQTLSITWSSQNQSRIGVYLQSASGSDIDSSSFMNQYCRSLGSTGSDGCIIYYANPTVQSTTWTVHSSLPAGQYRLKVVVWDSSSISQAKLAYFSIAAPQNLAPSAPIISSTPSSATQNAPVTISVTAGIDPEGDQVNANCTATGSNYASQASTSGLGSGGRTVQHTFTFAASGTQTINCTSFDAGGHGSSTVNRTISVAPPVDASPAFSAPALASSVQMPGKIYFSGTASDDVGLQSISMLVNNNIVFTDVLSGASKNLNGYYFDSANSYAGNAGSYTVKLRVRDSAGHETDTYPFIVTVAAPAVAPDTTPDPFSFIPKTGITRSTVTESNAITVTGINSATTIGIVGGEYKIGSGSYTSQAGTVNNGAVVTVRLTSSASYSTSATATLTVGGVSSTFSVTTATGNPPTPTVSSVTPYTVTLGQSTTFIVTGTNLSSGMTWYLPNCQTATDQLLVVASSTRATFTCTPQLQGVQSGHIKAAGGGSVVGATLMMEVLLPAVAGFVDTPDFDKDDVVVGSCENGMDGGECVKYVQEFFSKNSPSHSLPLLGSPGYAYTAYDVWNKLSGRDAVVPRANSILVIDKWEKNPAGHVAVVTKVKKNSDGTYDLKVNESNWPSGKKQACNATYRYDPTTSSVKHDGGGTAYTIRGFLYAEAPTVAVYDFWLKSKSFDPAGGGVFDAQFKIKNLTGQTITLDEIALAAHQETGAFVANFGEKDGEERVSKNVQIKAGEYYQFDLAYWKPTSGVYDIVAKVRQGNTWQELGHQRVTVVSAAPGATTLDSASQVNASAGGTITITNNANVGGATITLPAPSKSTANGGNGSSAVQPVTITLGGQSLSVVSTTDNAVLTVRTATVNGASTQVLAVSQGSVKVSASAPQQPLLHVAGSGNGILVTADAAGATVSSTINAVTGKTIIAVSSGVVMLPSNAFASVNGFAAIKDGRIYAGETVEFDSAGKVAKVRLGSADGSEGLAGDPLAIAGGNGLTIKAAVPNLAGTSARIGGSKRLDRVADEVVTAADGLNPFGTAQYTSGVTLFVNANSFFYALPVGSITVDTSRRDGITINANGIMEIVKNGVVISFSPSVSDYAQFAEQLVKLDKNATLTVTEGGGLQATFNGTDYLLQPGWTATGVVGGQAGFTLNQQGLVIYQDRVGIVQTLYPVFADLAQLLAAFKAQDTNVSVTGHNEGSVTVKFQGNFYILVPDYTLSAIPPQHANDAWWAGADGKLYIRNSDGKTAQGFIVKSKISPSDLKQL